MEGLKEIVLDCLKRYWPWIIGVGIILLASYVCSMNCLSREKMVLLNIETTAIVLLLAVIFIYAVVVAASSERRFLNTLGKVSSSYWTYCVLFILVMIAINSTWLKILSHNFFTDYEGGEVFFRSNRWNDYREIVFKAPVMEEPLFRVLPFMVASTVLLFVRNRVWRIILGVVMCVAIVCVQLQFGYAHYVGDDYADIFADVPEPHIYLQGGGGIIYATTYGVVLYYVYRILRKKKPGRKKIFVLLSAHLFAYVASVSVHAGYNLFCIHSGTWDYAYTRVHEICNVV